MSHLDFSIGTNNTFNLANNEDPQGNILFMLILLAIGVSRSMGKIRKRIMRYTFFNSKEFLAPSSEEVHILEETDEKFRNYYLTHLKPLQEKIENKRLKLLEGMRRCIQNIAVLTFLILILMIGIPLIINSSKLSEFTYLLICGLTVYCFVTLASYATYKFLDNHFKKENKINFLPIILRYLGNVIPVRESWDLNPLKSFHLFAEYNQIEQEDHFKLTYKETEIELVELNLTNKVEQYNSKGEVEIKIHPIFKGLLVLTQFPKKFIGHTFITSNPKLTPSNSLAPVEIENPSGSKLLRVFSTDQVQARYIITLSFIERWFTLLRNFGQNFGGLEFSSSKQNVYVGPIMADVRCVFYDQQMLMGIGTTKNLFEFGYLLESALSIKVPLTFINEIEALYALIDELKINQKLNL